jgi:type III restriction enzyme
MSIKTLKEFQERAIESGVSLFAHAKKQLDVAPKDAASRAHAVNHNGYLLIEAPTGSGKTLMAGHIVEKFSNQENVVWFWFAPFKGVVGQTAGFLREQFQGLRLREMQEDRAVQNSRSGDVFVTTWQTVATRVKDSRNVRKEGEKNPSVDELIAGLRDMGFRIGVVVDEAHHSFHGDTQAAQFFHSILSPEYTVLITATPDDGDIADFKERLGITELHRIRVSRADAVGAGLVKSGVKCAAYMVDAGQEKLVDLQATALRDGVALHRKIKETLKAEGISLTPLLLVQVDSKDKSVQRAKEKLMGFGFTEKQIAIHTADEPDAGLLAIANDEEREVLIFKMAVALGFDAPRAFALVSMRATQDTDFGVQLVGRILRVHRRLQGRAVQNKLPDLLRYGFVFLADPEAQDGLDKAGQKMNQIQTEYAKISPTTTIVTVGGETMVQVMEQGGQTSLYQTPAPELEFRLDGGSVIETSSTTAPPPLPTLPTGFLGRLGFTDEPTGGTGSHTSGTSSGVLVGTSRYHLKAGVPRRFKTELQCPDPEVTEQDCAKRFTVSAGELLDAVIARVNVTRKTLEVFTQQLEIEFISVKLDADEAARAAYRALRQSDMFDPRMLKRALLDKLQGVLRDRAMEEANDPEAVERLLNILLATHPDILFEAQKKALNATAEIEEAEELPDEVVADSPLPTSSKNIYGIMPPDLNTWEHPFAQLLDIDQHGVVQWWHRNPVRKPWSVGVVLSNGSAFYPDFIIGVRDRKTEDNAILVETKYDYRNESQLPKTHSEHKIYGKVLILTQDGQARWITVLYDEKQDTASPDRLFSTLILQNY